MKEEEHKCNNPLCPGYQEQPLFSTKKVISTSEVDAFIVKDNSLAIFIGTCLQRHFRGDGGDLDPDDLVRHFDAIMHDESVMSSYNYDGVPEGMIWIKTEAERDVTTIMFPHEY